nr:MAG TPA: hypothetical protein [Caudoviricetes sp.]
MRNDTDEVYVVKRRPRVCGAFSYLVAYRWARMIFLAMVEGFFFKNFFLAQVSTF